MHVFRTFTLCALLCAAGAAGQAPPTPLPPLPVSHMALTTFAPDGSSQRLVIQVDGSYTLVERTRSSRSEGPRQRVVAEGNLEQRRHLRLRSAMEALCLGEQPSTPASSSTPRFILRAAGPAPYGGSVRGRLGGAVDPRVNALVADLQQLAESLERPAPAQGRGLASALQSTRELEGEIRAAGVHTELTTEDGVVIVAGAELNAVARAHPGQRVRIGARELVSERGGASLELAELRSLRKVSRTGTYRIDPAGAAHVLGWVRRSQLRGPVAAALDGRKVRVLGWEVLDAEDRSVHTILLGGFAVEVPEGGTMRDYTTPDGSVSQAHFVPGEQLLATALEGGRVRLSDRELGFEGTLPASLVRFRGEPDFFLP